MGFGRVTMGFGVVTNLGLVTHPGLVTKLGLVTHPGLVTELGPAANAAPHRPRPGLLDRPLALARATRTAMARAKVTCWGAQEGGPMTDDVPSARPDASVDAGRGRWPEPVELVEPAATQPISFENFVRTETAGLLRSAYLLTGNAASAEDIVQETLTRLFPRWARVQDAAYPQAYVRRSLVNTFLNSRRPRSATEIVVDDVGDRPSPVDLAQGVADSDLVWSLLGRLGERQRAVLVLRYFHDWTDADIAAAVGCRTGTVRSLLSRGLTALRTELAAGARAEGGVGDA